MSQSPPRCDCYSQAVDDGRDRCSNPLKARFNCDGPCGRRVPSCYRRRGTLRTRTCKDCDTEEQETE